MITVTINGKEIKLEKPVTVLEAAKEHGIKIPHFCHHPLLEKWGGCRMCVVEVEKMPRLQTSCTLMTADGMVVRTESEEITKARKAVLEFLLINHPLECPYCDKAGECDLQDLTVQYGAADGRFEEGKRKHPESFEDPLIVRNMDRCILCTRCVRMCDGVQGASAIAVTNRGNHSFIEPFSGGRYNCEYCGNCLTVCPVGAIMSRLHRHAYRSWMIEEKVQSVCAFCGVGCSMILQVRSGTLMRTLPKIGLGINKGILCARGRFGYGYIQSSERLTKPLIRKNGQLEEASWEDALSLVASKLAGIRDSSGGEAIGGIVSGRCTNEENYVFQKLFRTGLKSNNIDSIARAGIAVAQPYIEDVLGQGATANIMSGILNSDGVFVAGGDPTHINPVFGVQIRNAHKRGAKVFTIGYTPGLSRFRARGIYPYPFTESTVLSAMLGGLLKAKNLSGENQSFEAKIKEFKASSLDDTEKTCGISKDDIQKAVEDLSQLASVSMVIGPEIVQRTDAGRSLFLLTAIAYVLNARVFLLSEKPNEQGLMEMGCLPDTLPGGRPLDLESFRKRYEELWETEIPSTPGMTLFEMIEAANSGKIKAMYIMGDNPLFNLPDSAFIKSAFNKLDFLVVQDIFMTETAEVADIVLPALGWSEKDGTYTNLERRMQRLRKAVNRQGMEDWKILSEIGRKMGLKMNYNSSADIMDEISKVSHLHAGLTYDELDKGNDLWPYKGDPLRHKPGAGGIGITDAWVPSERDALYLTIEKHMFLSGSVSRQSTALNSIYEEPYAKISPDAAKKHGLTNNDLVNVKTEKGSIPLPVKIEKGLSDNVVMLTNNFKDKAAMSLMPLKIDATTKAPCLNGVKAEIGKVKK